MKKCLIAVATTMFLVSSLAVISEDAKEMTMKGKLSKAEKEGQVTYTLTTADGECVLPHPKPEQEGEKVIVLDDFVGADVEVTALVITTEKEGKKVVTVKKVVDVKKIEEQQ